MKEIKVDKSLFSFSNSIEKGKKVKVTTLKNNNLQIMYVDVHEPEEIVEALRKEFGIYVQVKALEAGDYAFSNLLIERKTLQDFYNSIVHGDKHIWKQVIKLKNVSERPYLIIERWNPYFFTNKRKERTVYGALARISLMGINVVTLQGSGKDFGEFVTFLAYLFFSSDKKKVSLKPVPQKLKERTKKEIISDMLVMIPMIGRKQADELADRISSVKELCDKSTEDWKKICPHLGRKRLKILKWILKGVKEDEERDLDSDKVQK